MDSKRNSSTSDRLKNLDRQIYIIAAGIFSLDALLLFGGLSWVISVPAVILSTPILIIVFNLSKQEPVADTVSPEGCNDDLTLPSEIETRDSRVADTPSSDLKEMQLLLISNTSMGKSDITQHLNSWGISYKTVKSSARAFATLIESSVAQKPYQTVLVDQPHLDMDDCQFAIALRAEPLLQSLYLIHAGGSVIPSRAEQLQAAGYSKILPTPIDKTLLYSALYSAREVQTHHNVVQLLDHYEADKQQQPLEILIASNNNNDCNKLRRLLSAAGHQTFLITEGTQILDALDTHHFDLAILDADMPDISGIEVIKLYRFTHLNQPWVFFVLLLDNPNSQTIQSCEIADIDNLLVKPLSTQRLHATIAEAIQQERDKNEVFGYHASTGRHPSQNDDLTLDTHQLEELKRLGKEKGFLLELVHQFDKESNDLTHGLEEAVLNKEVKSIIEYGHRLKDTAGNLGALNLYRLAVRTTRITQASSSLELDNLVKEIGTCRTSTIQALLDHVSKGNNSAYQKE
jgi:two-component system sensor histidine kinase RpfC